jgi:hypothetical protein
MQLHNTLQNAGADVYFGVPGNDGGAPVLSYTAIAMPGGAFATATTSPITIAGTHHLINVHVLCMCVVCLLFVCLFVCLLAILTFYTATLFNTTIAFTELLQA